MPALVYPTGPFQPFTKILSSEVNGKFSAITDLLNITKLNDTNIQDRGISWIKLTLETASQVAVTDTLGALTVAAFLPTANGGLGFIFTPSTLDIGQVVQVNQAGTALTIDTVPDAPTGKIYAFYRFS